MHVASYSEYCLHMVTVYMHQCIGTVNKAGDTPLSLAYKKRHLKTIKYLAQEHQCDPKCVWTANC